MDGFIRTREPSFKVDYSLIGLVLPKNSTKMLAKPSLKPLFQIHIKQNQVEFFSVQAVCDSILINSLNVGADKTDNTRQPNKGWPDFIWLAGKACLTQSKLLHSFERTREKKFPFCFLELRLLLLF